MQALQWALDHPPSSSGAILVCASARLTAQNIALLGVARTAIMSDPDFAGRRLPRRLAPRARTRDRADARPHHLPLGGVDEAQVRSAPARRRERPDDVGSRLRGRALPRPPGRVVRRALRRAQLPVPEPRRWTTSTRSPIRGSSWRRSRRASSRSRSTPTGVSAASTRATSSSNCGRRRRGEPRRDHLALGARLVPARRRAVSPARRRSARMTPSQPIGDPRVLPKRRSACSMARGCGR